MPAAKRRPAHAVDALVLEMISTNDRPVGAYQLLGAAHARGEKLHPVQIYRALDRLRSQKRIRRIDTLNAYTSDTASGLMLVCKACGGATLLDDADLSSEIARILKTQKFCAGEQLPELSGRCRDCYIAALSS